MNLKNAIFAVAISLASSSSLLSAQTAPPALRPLPEGTTAARPCPESCPKAPAPELSVHTFYLHNSIQASDANETFTVLRQILPHDTKAFLVPNENAIVMEATQDQIALAQRLIDDLDRPKKDYRLTYTVSEMDGGKRISAERFVLIVPAGQITTLKQGSRIPVITGMLDPNSKASQVSYIDVGMNFDSRIAEAGDGGMLVFNVEQSSVGATDAGVSPLNPVLHQIVVKGEALLSVGKPLMLGSADVPGSTRHIEVEVLMEQLP
jgi:type II secretory pathway component GspD/PulD (secretin)